MSQAGDLLLLMSVRHRLTSLTLELLSTLGNSRLHQALPFLQGSRCTAVFRARVCKVTFQSSFLKSVECSSKMLITVNSRGIQEHAVLPKSCSVPYRIHFLFLQVSIPSFPFLVLVANQPAGKELKYPFMLLEVSLQRIPSGGEHCLPAAHKY